MVGSHFANPPYPVSRRRESISDRRRKVASHLAKKKKVRVAFKKNRQKRTRANDLTRSYHANDLTKAEPASAERVRAKGELSRHRTIMTDVAEGTDGGGRYRRFRGLTLR